MALWESEVWHLDSDVWHCGENEVTILKAEETL